MEASPKWSLFDLSEQKVMVVLSVLVLTRETGFVARPDETHKNYTNYSMPRRRAEEAADLL